MEEKRCLTDEYTEKSSDPPPPYNMQVVQPPYGNYGNHTQSSLPYVIIQGDQQLPPYQVHTQQPQMVPPGTIIVTTQSSEPPPPDYLGYAIFVTICCCWPLGIVAILRSADSRAAASRGDMQAAKIKSREAKKMANIALGIGIVFMVLSVLLCVVYLFVLLNSYRFWVH